MCALEKCDVTITCIFRVNLVRTASAHCKCTSIQLHNIYIAVCYFYFLRHEGCKVALITSILYIDRNRSSVKLNILCSAVACICPNNNAPAAPGDRPCNVTPHGAITPLSFRWDLPPPDEIFCKFDHGVVLLYQMYKCHVPTKCMVSLVGKFNRIAPISGLNCSPP